MKSSSPWSVKGVEPEAREAAKMAARRAGVPLGVWLSSVIRRTATDQLKSGGATAAAQASMDARPDAAESNPPGGHRPPALTTEAVLESINRLAAKIEASEARTSEAIAPLAEKVQSLSQQIEAVKESGSVDSAPLERALSRMSERLDSMEEGPRNTAATRERRRQGFFSRLFSD
jgi:localization factor PodJL